MNLAYKYPIVYWNTANLIVDSGGIQSNNEDEDDEEIEVDSDEITIENDVDDDEYEEEWEEANEINSGDVEDKKKKKVKNIDYGKIASVIGKMGNYGIKVSPPDINKSSFTFTPLAKENLILYGMRGIARISGDKIVEIMSHRPYVSLKDFLSKNNLNKIQITNLIKSGAFDAVESKPREVIMHEYIESVADKKERLTLQNMQMLITKDLIPEEMTFYARLFLFNKFLKGNKKDNYYELNSPAIDFISNNFSADYIDNGNYILQKIWDNIYKKAMEPMRDYLKEHKDEMLKKLNNALYNEVAEKYSNGNISSWEMDSISFYYHEHELAAAAKIYDDFFTLPEEPQLDYSFESKNGQEIKIFRLSRIIGTVIDKNKMHNTITLLTPTGVVNVKIYKNQFALYDKQLSQKDNEGKKHVIEKSWFSRGTKLVVQGIRKGQDFIPKKYKNSLYPIITKITKIDGEYLEFQEKRAEVE